MLATPKVSLHSFAVRLYYSPVFGPVCVGTLRRVLEVSFQRFYGILLTLRPVFEESFPDAALPGGLCAKFVHINSELLILRIGTSLEKQ
jgi:hypothetical protein